MIFYSLSRYFSIIFYNYFSTNPNPYCYCLLRSQQHASRCTEFMHQKAPGASDFSKVPGAILRLDTLMLAHESIFLCVIGQSLSFCFGAKFLSCINSLPFRDFPVHLCSKHKIDCFRVIPFNSVLHFLFLIKFEF